MSRTAPLTVFELGPDPGMPPTTYVVPPADLEVRRRKVSLALKVAPGGRRRHWVWVAETRYGRYELDRWVLVELGLTVPEEAPWEALESLCGRGGPFEWPHWECRQVCAGCRAALLASPEVPSGG